MVPWLRKMLRANLPPQAALADAEEELEEVHAALDDAPGYDDLLETEEVDHGEVEALKQQVAQLEAELRPLRSLKERMLAVINGGSDG